MLLLLALAALAGLVAFASFVWLLVVAFKTHVGWGLAVLFLPLAPIVFAIKHWQASKRPFLLNLGSSLASLTLFFAAGGVAVMTAAGMAADSAAMGDPSSDQLAPQVSEEVAEDVAVTDSASARGPDASGPTPAPYEGVAGLEPSSPSMESIEATLAVPTPRQRRIHGEISVDQIDDSHVGNALRVVSRSGTNTLAVLTAVSPSELTFAREVGGGTIEFVLRRDEIESVTSIQ